LRFENLTQILNILYEHQDEAYRRFNESLIPGAENTSIGVRMPLLKIIAKELCRENWQEFLLETEACSVYELVMLRGLVTACAPCDYNTRLKLISTHIPSISNWALCDSFCGALKDTKRHLPEMWEFLQPYLISRNTYDLRFAIVMLMNYYLTDTYSDQAISTLAEIRHEDYYVNMAVAWALSMAFVKYQDDVLRLLERKMLSPWVHNKTIQKCRESRRVSPGDKQQLLSLKL